MRFLLFVVAVIAGVVAYCLYPTDGPPPIEPVLRDLTITATGFPPSVPGSGGVHGAFFDVSLHEQDGKAIVRADGNDVTFESIRGGDASFSPQAVPEGAPDHDQIATESEKGGYIATISPGGTYATVLVPPIVVYDDQWDGTGSNPAAATLVQVSVHLPGWESFTWSGGLPPERGDDPLSNDKGASMHWDEYADSNGTIPAIELTGVNLTQQETNQEHLFISGILAGIAGAALIAVLTEWSAIVRDRRQSRVRPK